MQNKIMCYCQFDNQLGFHPDSARLYNVINYVLPINKMQRPIVKKDFHSLSKIPNFNCDQIEDQLLLYICGNGGVGKNKVIYVIELGCILLLRNSDLVITAPTGTKADNIGGSTIHISLDIDVRNRHEKSNTISNLWTA